MIMDNTPWWNQRWPWLLMLGPFIVLLAGSYTGWLAFSRPDALVVGDYYKQGKAINQDLRRDRAASEMGMVAALRYDAARGVLTGKIDGHSVMPETVVVHLVHATQPSKDVVLQVHPAADGAFDAPLPMLERSRWQVLVESDKRDWRLEGRWQWPEQREMNLNAGNL
ncbi:FixH family protein [Pseudoduganella ginsengisoli]|uniref:Cytochrome oxidase assembly protein n=2 Tax=Pseudoduganella ginsengisoli TaxID=1462440 RepID=A0A6L6Q129_9BURK|nr:cytochrome oxidase assembly protein [Pseudoduganella ginsengisoli]